MPLPEPVSLDHLLAQVSRMHHHRAHELLDRLGLYRGQPPVLFALWEQDGLTHCELSKRLGITPATTTKMLQRMEKTGFIQRRPDENDQRISRVYLTGAGKAVRNDLEAVWRQMEEEVFRGFDAEERTIMRGYLLRLRNNLENVIQKEMPL